MKKPQINSEKLKNGLRRAMWLFMALLFVITGVGIGIYAFWQATHPAKNDTQQDQANSCQIQQVANSKTLPAPEPFKPGGDVTKLQKTDLSKGSGKEIKSGDCITVKYYGTLATTGAVFDQDFDKPLALKVKIGVGQVIPGWDLGIPGMKVGGTRRLVIPSELAYGSNAQSSIPANSDLVFVVNAVSD